MTLSDDEQKKKLQMCLQIFVCVLHYSILLYITVYLPIHLVNLLYQSQELLMPHSFYIRMPGVRLDELAPCLP